MTRKPFRVRCIVPGCHHTRGFDVDPGGYEIVCAEHWRGVPMATRRRRAWIARRLRKLMLSAEERSAHPAPPYAWAADPLVSPGTTRRWLRYDEAGDGFRRHMILAGAARRNWALATAQAIERAVGL